MAALDHETRSRADPAVEALVQGLPAESEAERWRRALLTSEHKRWQHGIILKVSEKAFGAGRMVPVTRAG